MATTKPDKKEHHTEETSLKGTALGVGFVGLVILVSFITLYGLYLDRL